MTQSNNKNDPGSKARVTRTSEHRSPEAVRRLGRALIALARAQLEAEAQAHDGTKDALSGKSSSVTTTASTRSGSRSSPSKRGNAGTGDAA